MKKPALALSISLIALTFFSSCSLTTLPVDTEAEPSACQLEAHPKNTGNLTQWTHKQTLDLAQITHELYHPRVGTDLALDSLFLMSDKTMAVVDPNTQTILKTIPFEIPCGTSGCRVDNFQVHSSNGDAYVYTSTAFSNGSMTRYYHYRGSLVVFDNLLNNFTMTVPYTEGQVSVASDGTATQALVSGYFLPELLTCTGCSATNGTKIYESSPATSIVQIPSAETSQIMQAHGPAVYSSDKTEIAISNDGTVFVIDSKTHKQVGVTFDGAKTFGSDGKILDLKFSPNVDSHLLLIVLDNHRAALFDYVSGKVLRKFESLAIGVNVNFSTMGDKAVFWNEHLVSVLEVNKNCPLVMFNTNSPIAKTEFAPLSDQLVIATFGSVQILNPITKEKITLKEAKSSDPKNGSYDFSFSSQGKTLNVWDQILNSYPIMIGSKTVWVFE